VLEAIREPDFLAHAVRLGPVLRQRRDGVAARHAGIGEVRGLGPMLALELEKRTPDGAKAVVDAAFDRGLLLLSCGLYGNVLRLLPPLTISDEELDEGLGLLDEALATGLAG
jgi:4-aminobutyrate aminotransferase-like enzyme